MKNLTFLLLLLILPSCSKDESSSASQVTKELRDTRWRFTEYLVIPDSGGIVWRCEGYNGYTMKFIGLDNLLEVNTGVTVREGSWAVYEGVGGDILQIQTPEVIKDVYQLSGKWLIIQHTENTLVLEQKIEKFTLKASLILFN